MTLQLQRGAIAAKLLNVFDDYLELVFKGMWEEGLNLGDQEIFLNLLSTSNNIDVQKLLDAAQSQAVKDELINNTNMAVEKGAFGIPTFLVNDQEIFFGKDSLQDLEDFISN